jgi:hypothetical protein
MTSLTMCGMIMEGTIVHLETFPCIKSFHIIAGRCVADFLATPIY